MRFGIRRRRANARAGRAPRNEQRIHTPSEQMTGQRRPGKRTRVFLMNDVLACLRFDPFVDFTGRLKGYGVTNLYDLGNYDWRFSPRKMTKIENHLREMPHNPIRSSDARYEKLLTRYREYKKRYPDRSPIYYDNRSSWMM